MSRAADTDESEATDVGSVASDPEAVLTDPRCKPHEGPLRVLVGKERFSENHAWSEMPQHRLSSLAARALAGIGLDVFAT